MRRKKRIAMGRCALIIGSAAILATPAAAAPWVRGYVIDKYEPAFYYGAKSGTMEPGTDCPKGTNPDNDYNALLKTGWRTDAEIADVLRSATVKVNGTFNTNREFRLSAALRYRGFRRDIDSWVNPFTAPDPGVQEVTGKIAEGFDLDHNPNTGFLSPEGRKGIDNNLYRVMGCNMSYRGVPYTAYLSTRGNDKMLEGLFTIVVRITGNADPMNDNNAVVEIGYSPDHIVKNSVGVVPDYSYKMAKTAQYTRLKATIKNGVVETEQVSDLRLPEFAWFENNRGGADFHQGQLRLVMDPDGGLSGLLGGYLDWRDIYGKDTFDTSSSAGTRETYYHENQIAKYYALKRNADGMRDPNTGQNNGISAAYRLTAKSAYVVDPARPAMINEPVTSLVPAVYRTLFLKAATTKTIIPDPPRKAGEYDGDSDPKDDTQAPKNAKTSASNDQQQIQSGSTSSR
jgi:hypothetical protein